MKDNSSASFLSQTFILWTKRALEFSNFWVVGWNLTKFLKSCLKLQVSFSLNFGSLFSVMRDNIVFSRNCTWFLQKELIKVQNVRLSTAHVKFLQISTLIGSLKYIKFSLKKYRRVISHDPKYWCKIWRKTELLFQKRQQFGKIWTEHSKISKVCTFIGSYCAKYLMFNLKRYRGVIFEDTEEWCKILRKTGLWSRK